MFGHFVSEDNMYWRLLIELRRILSLLLSKHFDTECLDYLENLISEYHELYLKMFGSLKPKHHFMLHYPLVIKIMGPLVHLQAVRGQSKHREGKSTSNSVATQDICKTIAIKQQLILSNRLLLRKGFDPGFSSGVLKEMSGETFNALQNYLSLNNCISNDYSSTETISVFHTQYKKDFTIITSMVDDFPIFS